MTRPSPPAAAEENTLVLRPIGGLICRHDEIGRLAPDHASSSRTTNPILLIIDGAEKSIARYADSKYDCQVRNRR